ncbi:MAG: PadR family transcriptional regulator [Acidimicrobiia bacterium]
MLALSILGLLMSEPLHGYEIRKQLGELMGLTGAISYGSLYPTLAKLHSQGLINTTFNTPEKKKRVEIFSTGSLTGDIVFGSRHIEQNKTPILSPRKSKKVYFITEKGKISFKEKLVTSFVKHADDDRAFVAHLAFLDFATTEEKQTFIDERSDVLQKRLLSIPISDNHALKLWHDVEREYIENQISFLQNLNEEIMRVTGSER